MAITTLDGALAGMKPPSYFTKAASGTLVAGRPWTPLYAAGYPGAATAYAGGLNGTNLTALTGQIVIPAASGNTHLSRFSAIISAQGGLLMLCDRIWHNSITVTSTAAQAITTAAWPARDMNGATAGAGLLAAFECSALMGAGTPTVTMTYTNSDNVATKSASLLIATTTTSPAGTFYPLGLATGDVGIRSIQSVTLNATMTSGSAGLVLYRPLATLEISAAAIPNAVDVLTSGFPRCYDTTVPFLVFIPNTTTTTLMHGQVVFSQG